MNKKVTRRIAIGTIIGSTAAATYVIRSLRARYRVRPTGAEHPWDYEEEWQRVLTKINVPVKEVAGPATFTLDYRPRVGTHFQVLSLYASYRHVTGLPPAKYPQAPLFCYVVDGRVRSVSPVVSHHPALLIHVDNQVTMSKHQYEHKTGAECVLVPSGDSFDYYQMRNDVPERLAVTKVDRACSALGPGLMCEYPRDKSLTLGAKWTLPETSRNALELPCEAVGFAEVVGATTVKIQAVRQLNNQEFQRYIIRQTEEDTRSVKEEGKSTADVEKVGNERLQRALKEESTFAFYLDCHVDLKSGVSMRRSIRTVTHHPTTPDLDHTGILITQVLPA